MRLNERFQNRWSYSAVAGLSGLIFAGLFFAAVSEFDISLSDFVKSTLFGFGAVPAAFLCWPYKTRRSTGRMILAGILTVLTALLFLSWVIGAAVLVESQITLKELLSAFVFLPVMTIFFASIVTLGIPYIIGILLSLPFREAPGSGDERL